MLSTALAEKNDLKDESLNVTDILEKPVHTAIQNYLQAAAGDHEKAVRKPGLYLGSDDLEKIKRLTRQVNQLPTKPEEVASYLGYSESFIAGLRPSDIAKLHQQLKDLATTWYGIEKKMIEVGNTLITFNGILKSYGSSICNLIRKLEGYTSYQGVIADITPEDLATLPSVPLKTDAQRAIHPLLALIKEIVNTVDEHKKSANNVKNLITFFRTDLRTARDEITRKLALIVKTDGNELAAELNEEISRFNARIEELGRSYSTYTIYKWVGLWWGPAGLGITWSIFGSDANRIKAEYEKEIQNKKKLESRLANINQGIPALLRLEADLQNMQLLIEEALNGAGNLENIWSLIGAYITASVSKIRDTDDATALFIFEARISHMLNQWDNVERQAQGLVTAINQDAVSIPA
ncbi:hypothetical protein EGJ27_23325 [Pseudomonas sp. v388]|uniref:alpha-xenorhabdolysin family binary toxin subunit A n=1 Tax=Pseudomonas sp. v388 TaxID=2479849 RepID=UPI000F7747D4|nr:alpha-xenorhabdolysin family binary toxin subunit A [Pseudomonas sp. v388]RRV04206.1 hypothetical protein EGJ27_23325 [Pseudomonas sp. v388]